MRYAPAAIASAVMTVDDRRLFGLLVIVTVYGLAPELKAIRISPGSHVKAVAVVGAAARVIATLASAFRLGIVTAVGAGIDLPF